MCTLKRFALIVIAYLAATLAATLSFGLTSNPLDSLFQLYSGSDFYRQVMLDSFLKGARAVFIVELIPALGWIIYSEIRAERRLWFYILVANISPLLFGAAFPYFLLAPLAMPLLFIGAGASFGLTYWAIAGRSAGCLPSIPVLRNN